MEQPQPNGATPDDLAKAKSIIATLSNSFSAKVVGQEGLRLSLLTSLIVGGHVLLESVPGLAKTTAVQTLAESINASFKRIQCTPDLLPSDIIGTQLYDYSKGDFKTQLGPVHANFVLLDEINRSSAKTQSAMLEAMQEKQTSIGGEIYKLPRPFIVLATQNPIEQEGTYELPEAQLDRFLLKEVLTYPTPQEEVEVLRRLDSGVLTRPTMPTSITVEDILFLQDLLAKIFVDNSIKQYIVSIVTATRQADKVIDVKLAKYIQYGASPRASIAFQQVARALALMDGRDHVIPEDVKKLRHSILRHRVILNFEAVADQVHPEVIIEAIFGAIQTP
ncbi:MoxR family ATPase [Microbacteriaceae bacterium]|nr:MoxR family ATPase [Candidatus Saccharibacteria bacterium]